MPASCASRPAVAYRGGVSRSRSRSAVAVGGRGSRITALVLTLVASKIASAQVMISGRITGPRFEGSHETIPFTGVLAFASLDGAESETLQFRTWETEPAGWYRFSGLAGRYTLLLTKPAGFVRPVVVTNVFTEPLDRVVIPVSPRFDHFVFDEGAWDRRAAHEYWQPFVARGTSVTHVGLRFAHDGVDGAGPGSQTLVVSIHKKGDGEMLAWPQVGPAMPIVGVDSGGPKNYLWSCGWLSGEVPLTAGETYAVRVHAENPGGGFQPFWKPTGDPTRTAWRLDPPLKEKASSKEPKAVAPKLTAAGAELWLSISGDGDGLLLPYQKCVHKEFVELSTIGKRWSQSYVARGRSLAAVVLYAAVSGAQPPLSRQRASVRVRRGDGPLGGGFLAVKKIAIGSGNWTGDASWGAFGAVFAPGEVVVEPGEAYSIEFESIELDETIAGFVNIKGQVSDGRAGFNPYKKHALDVYEPGHAYRDGEAVDFDLDMQVVEYEKSPSGWSNAIDPRNLMTNGEFESGELPCAGVPDWKLEGWARFSILPSTEHQVILEEPERKNRILRLVATKGAKKAVDGGCVQRVEGLTRSDTYRVSARVRSSYAVDIEHQCQMGIDPTGQTTDVDATTIRWTALPGLYGLWVTHTSEPMRPRGSQLSVWLRARSQSEQDKFPFKADFDAIAVHKVETGAPR